MFLCLLYVLDSILSDVSYPIIRCMEKSRINTEATYNTTFCKITKTIFVVILIFIKRIGCRETKAYKGVNSFLAFAFRNSTTENKILCTYGNDGFLFENSINY
jgi:hypothetical protein